MQWAVHYLCQMNDCGIGCFFFNYIIFIFEQVVQENTVRCGCDSFLVSGFVQNNVQVIIVFLLWVVLDVSGVVISYCVFGVLKHMVHANFFVECFEEVVLGLSLIFWVCMKLVEFREVVEYLFFEVCEYWDVRVGCFMKCQVTVVECKRWVACGDQSCQVLVWIFYQDNGIYGEFNFLQYFKSGSLSVEDYYIDS